MKVPHIALPNLFQPPCNPKSFPIVIYIFSLQMLYINIHE